MTGIPPQLSPAKRAANLELPGITFHPARVMKATAIRPSNATLTNATVADAWLPERGTQELPETRPVVHAINGSDKPRMRTGSIVHVSR